MKRAFLLVGMAAGLAFGAARVKTWAGVHFYVKAGDVRHSRHAAIHL